MPPSYDYFSSGGLEAQVAVLTSKIEQLEKQLAEHRDALRADRDALGGDMRAIRIDMRALAEFGEAEARELCREVIRAESAGTTNTRDNMMRLVTFAVSIGTAIFVIRGGR